RHDRPVPVEVSRPIYGKALPWSKPVNSLLRWLLHRQMATEIFWAGSTNLVQSRLKPLPRSVRLRAVWFRPQTRRRRFSGELFHRG
ncbi:hypothetical protein, partial [Bowmanella yangjiangensis]